MSKHVGGKLVIKKRQIWQFSLDAAHIQSVNIYENLDAPKIDKKMFGMRRRFGRKIQQKRQIFGLQRHIQNVSILKNLNKVKNFCILLY